MWEGILCSRLLHVSPLIQWHPSQIDHPVFETRSLKKNKGGGKNSDEKIGGKIGGGKVGGKVGLY
jgi:hypothetical protein